MRQTLSVLFLIFLSLSVRSGVAGNLGECPEKRDFLSRYFQSLLFPEDSIRPPAFSLPDPETGAFFTIRTLDFKSKPTATISDLILKTPSAFMNSSGYHLQGEKMTELLIDGNAFYTNNLLSVQTIPANVAEKIEIFDDPSNPMSFNGIDDDESSKAINFIPKKEYQEKSLSGKFYGGWGYKNFWNAGAAFTYFEKSRIVNVMAQTNNINLSNYSLMDMFNAQGTSNITSFDEHASEDIAGNFINTLNTVDFAVIDQQHGSNEDISAGVSYFDRYKKVQYSVNYFFNITNNATNGTFNRNYFSNDKLNTNYMEDVAAKSLNYNHRFKTRFSYHINDLNLLRVGFSLNTQKTTGDNYIQTRYKSNSILIANIVDTTHLNLSGFNFLTEVNYWKKFKKEGRTLMVDILPAFASQDNDNTFNSMANFYRNPKLVNNNLDFFLQYHAKSYDISGDVIYTEPLAKHNTLMFSYKFGYSGTESDKSNDLSPDVVFQEHIKDSVSSYISINSYFRNSLGIVYQFARERMRINFGADLQYAALSNSVKEPFLKENRITLYHILPRASFYYNINKNNILRINYSSFTDVPSTIHLLETYSFDNPLNITVGNNELRSAWRNVVNIRYTLLTPKRQDYLFVYLRLNYTKDYIGNVSNYNYEGIYDTNFTKDRVTLTSFDNFDHYFHIYNYINYSFYFSKIKSNLDLYTIARYSETPGRVNGENGISKQSIAGAGVAFKSGISEKIDFTLSNLMYYNHVIPIWDKQNSSDYVTNQAMFSIFYSPWKGLTLQTDITDNYNFSQGDNNNYILWNIKLAYRFLKDKSLELSLNIHDILNQNQNVIYNITASYNEKSKTNNLQRYFMVSLAYDLSRPSRENR